MLKQKTQDSIAFLKSFARHPLDEIARLPDWSFKHVAIVQLIIAAISGALAGLLNPGFWKILQGFLLFPFFALILNLLLSSFFYYYFQIFERRTVSFQKLFNLAFFASLPFFLFHIASYVFIIADLFGLAMTAVLLIIGLTENFQLHKRKSLRLIAIIFSMLFLLWLMERISSARRDQAFLTQAPYFRPVEPNPPAPRTVSDSSVTSSKLT